MREEVFNPPPKGGVKIVDVKIANLQTKSHIIF